MARTEEKVESLIREDDEMEDVVDTVLERTDYGEETIEWSDVEDSLTTGQWGRLIQSGIIEETDDGLTVKNPEEVVKALEEDVDTDVEPNGWTWWDKAAGVVVLNMMLVYAFPPVRDFLGRMLNLVLGPLDMLLPYWTVILLLAVGTGALSTFLQDRLKDKEVIAHYKGQLNDLQEKAENADPDELDDIASDTSIFSIQKNMMKAQFRPMVWVMLVTIPVFLWLLWKAQTGHISAAERTVVVPALGTFNLTGSLLGPFEVWMGWYFICSVVFTQALRKIFGIKVMPDSSDVE